MRKIMSEQEMEKKRKRNSLILGVFMLGILVLGTVGYAFLSGPGTQVDVEEDTTQVVREIGGQWLATIDGQSFYFGNSPDAVKNISINTSLSLNSYAGKPLYISSDSGEILNEISSNLGRYTSRVQEACYGPCDKNLPEKDCSENLIIWKEGTEKRVYQLGSCVFIEGDLSSVDAFLYKMLGLI